jgi:hypothetical protein
MKAGRKAMKKATTRSIAARRFEEEELMKRIWKTITVAATVLVAGTSMAGLAPDLKCQATKNKLVGAYYACRQKAEATAVSKGGGPDYGKCSDKFTEKWNKAESDGGGLCPDNFMVTFEADAFVSEQATEAAQFVAGATTTTTTLGSCGDNHVNLAGEQCDGTDLGGNTCATFGRFGTIGCTAGCDLDLSGCTDCPASMLEYDGVCWVLGATGDNCDTACATKGMVYDSATMTVAGSSGTDANCQALLYGFAAPGDELTNAGGYCGAGETGFGCSVLPATGYRARCGTPATTSDDFFVDAQRVCACH